MSCYHGLHCITCDSRTGCGKNHAVQLMRDLIKIAPLVYQIRELDTMGYVEMSIMGYFDADPDVYLFDWLCEHREHNLEVYDEYGYYETTSPERFI